MPEPSSHSSLPEPRFAVGIDLGTTNSAVAFADTTDGVVRDFSVLQVTAPGELDHRDTLPSFHYAPSAAEADALRLPWDDTVSGYVVGVHAREHGAIIPERLTSSAKSWLCHGGVDRTTDLLPWHAAPGIERISPVTATARYLGHLRAAWDHAHPAHPLAGQDLVLTVPASFDETARELTVAAARAAGLSRLTLLEEPQAAFYAWLNDQGEGWENEWQSGQRILVCDIGGGTTDFSLIEVRDRPDGALSLHRIAVGDHLMLGGDNLDLALAHHVETGLGETEPLAPARWHALVRACRSAKEMLLGDAAPDQFTLSIPGAGSRLIGGSTQVSLGRDEVLALLIDGFMPWVDSDSRPRSVASGFQEFGLPYTADPAMTRHLAAFLADHAAATGEDPHSPDAILLNGGLFESPQLRQRWLEVVGSWVDAPLRILHAPRLDLAVARGAARYGMVRRGEGVRIAGGLARSYYLGVEDHTSGTVALCMAPAGLEEGSEVELPSVFDLHIRRPVEFPIFTSSTRTTDAAGALVEMDPGQLTALPPVRTVLKSGRKGQADTIPVRLVSRLTELGTLETRFREVQGDRSWQLAFDVRSLTAELTVASGEHGGRLEDAIVERAQTRVREAMTGPRAAGQDPTARLMKDLEGELEAGRNDWPPMLLRSLWETLLDGAPARTQSPAREARWMNLTGFALRPGYGIALDDWRVAETWKLFPSQVQNSNNEMCRAEWWILWRRLAGGLTRGQQETLAGPVIRALRASAGGAPLPKSLKAVYRGGSHEAAEVWRLLGSLERLPAAVRIELGDLVVAALRAKGPTVWSRAGLWALARLGARVPQYGPLQEVVPPDQAVSWLDSLIDLTPTDPATGFALMLIARRTGDRYRDIPTPSRDRVLRALEALDASDHYLSLVCEGGELDTQDQAAAFGDTLPAGIRIRG